jgi:hypothetical protein
MGRRGLPSWRAENVAPTNSETRWSLSMPCALMWRIGRLAPLSASHKAAAVSCGKATCPTHRQLTSLKNSKGDDGRGGEDPDGVRIDGRQRRRRRRRPIDFAPGFAYNVMTRHNKVYFSSVRRSQRWTSGGPPVEPAGSNAAAWEVTFVRDLGSILYLP